MAGEDLRRKTKSFLTDEHKIDLQELCEKLGTHQVNGLSGFDAEANLLRDGPNCFSPPKKPPKYKKLLKCLTCKEKEEASLITKYSLNLNSQIPKEVTVVRSGERRRVHGLNLAVGDLVVVKYGENIPADLRVISVEGLKVDNSLINTYVESPTVRSLTETCTSDNPMESRNIAFATARVLEGSGLGIVLATGDRSVVGRAARYSRLF